MWSFVVVCALTCCGQGPDSQVPPPAEAQVAELSQGLQTGSLIFSSGDCLAVKVFTQSQFTHVGGVVIEEGEPVVYDSMNGVGVRKTPFAEYLRQQIPSTVMIVHPLTKFSAEQATAYQKHLESQLGRKYAVKHHLTGQRCDGLHCSEYQTDALMAAEMITARQPPRVSPASLLDGVMSAKLYQPGPQCELKELDPPSPVGLPWYRRCWRATTVTCSKSAVQMRRWFLCR